MKKLLTLFICLSSSLAFAQQYQWMLWDTFPNLNFPVSFNNSLTVVGDTAYLFGVYTWDTAKTNGVKYQPDTKTWIQLPPHPTDIRTGTTTFYHNGYVYNGFGEDSLGNFYSDIYRMNIQTQDWEYAGGLTDTVMGYALSFQIGGKIFIGGSRLGEPITNSELSNTELYVWEYNPLNLSFTRRAGYPKKSVGLYQFNNGSRYFMGGGTTDGPSVAPSTYEYDWQNDTWIEKAPLPGWVSYSAPGNFTRGNYGYVYCGEGQDSTGFSVKKPHMLRYDMVNNQWALLDTFPYYYYAPRCNFMMGDDVYFLVINPDSSTKDLYSYQVFKYTDDTLTSTPIAFAEKNGLLAYPNPAPSGSAFTLILPFEANSCSYILNDITGKEYGFIVDYVDAHTVKIRPGNIAKGIYFLRVMHQNKVYPVKLFVD